jgi:hypothetical protein
VVAQNVAYGLVFNLLIVMMALSYWKAIFTKPEPIPAQFHLTKSQMNEILNGNIPEVILDRALPVRRVATLSHIQLSAWFVSCGRTLCCGYFDVACLLKWHSARSFVFTLWGCMLVSYTMRFQFLSVYVCLCRCKCHASSGVLVFVFCLFARSSKRPL